MKLTPIQDFLQANMQYNENYSYCQLNAKELGTYNGFDKTVLRDDTYNWVYTFKRMQGRYYRYLLYKETDNMYAGMFKPCDYKTDAIPIKNTWGGTGTVTSTTLDFGEYYNDIKIVTDFNYKDFCMLPLFRVFNGLTDVTERVGAVLYNDDNKAYTDYAHFIEHKQDITEFGIYLLIYKSDNGNLRTRQKYFVTCSYEGKTNRIDKPFPNNNYSNVITGLYYTSDLWTGSGDGSEGSRDGHIDGGNAYCNNFWRYNSESDFESGMDPAILEVPIYEFNCVNGRMKTDTIDIITKNFANYGLMWSESLNKAIHYGIDDDDPTGVHLGEIDDNGYITGKDFSGEDIENANNFSWENSADHTPNPDAEQDTNTYIRTVSIGGGVYPYNKADRWYILTEAQAIDLGDKLYNADETTLNKYLNGLKLFGENPINAIMQLTVYPFDVKALTNATATESIKFGTADLGINAYKLLPPFNSYMSFSGVKVPSKYHDFWDYEPYTNLYIYIPYCGVHKLSGAYIGKEITIDLIVEFSTGTCCACVSADGIIVDYFNGKIGVNIPVTGDNASAFTSRVNSSIMNLAGSAVTTVGGALTGNPIAIASGVTGLAHGALDISQVNGTDFSVSGSSSGNIDTIKPQYPYLIIERNTKLVPSNYGHSIGYNVQKYERLGDLDGFTTVFNPDLSDIADDMSTDEIEELKSILIGGFYV